MDHLLTEARNNASTHLDMLSARDLVRLMNTEDAKVAAAVATQADVIAQAIDHITDRLRRGGRLLYIGAGTSGRLGVLDAAECPPTFNSSPTQVVGIIAGGPTALTNAVEGAEDNPHAAVVDLQAKNLCRDDVLVGIATSGRTPYVVGALQYARQVHALAIGFACVPGSELEQHADLMIAPLVGPEVLTGSTRLKAGTATKLVLNMLTTGAMVRLGKTYGNLMVDLRATNTKLQARTNRILRHLLNIDQTAAAQLLADCGGELKTAIVAGKARLAPPDARNRLAEAKGLIHIAIGVPQRPHYPQLVLGIDGGGTRTTAVLRNANAFLGRGEGGPGNAKAVGQASACASIQAAIANAFTAAQLEPGRVGVLVMGLAGAGRAEEQQAFTEWAVTQQLATTVRVVADVELPLEALPERWGISVVAGTGSCVYGRTHDHRTARAGGWGPLLGDGGSAYEIVLQALRMVTCDADHIDYAPVLRSFLLQAMKLDQPEQLVAALHGGAWDRTRLAGLAPVIVHAAETGDTRAQHVLIEGATALANNVAAVVRWLGMDPTTVPLALTGGLLLHVPRYQRMMLDTLAANGIRAKQVVPMRHAAEVAATSALAELPS